MYLVTQHKASQVSESVRCNFTGPKDINLIVSKNNYLEIFKITTDGLVPFLEVPINGTIESIRKYREVNEKCDQLILLTKTNKLLFLKYEKGEIVTKLIGDLKEKIGKEREGKKIVRVDQDNRVLVLYLYFGILKIIPLNGNYESFNVRIDETEIIDLQFITKYYNGKKEIKCDKPTFIILYNVDQKYQHIKSYEIQDKEIKETLLKQNNVELESTMLIPVSIGFILLGKKSITYHNGSSYNSLNLSEESNLISFTEIDENRWLIGDSEGKLFILGNQKSLEIQYLGITSISSCISYLDNSYVFIGSESGDSQLIKLKEKIEIVNSFTNIGPIVDFILIDMERHGQCQMVTCSGIKKDGSLRVIRNGIGIEEQANIELPGIKGIWSLKKDYNSNFEKYIILAFIQETRIMTVQDESLQEVEESPLNSNQTTLLCDTLKDGYIQITPKSIRLISINNFKLLDEWKSDENIQQCCSGNESDIIISVGSGKIIHFEIKNDKIKIKNQTKLEYEVSCMNLDKNLLAVGLWTDYSIRLLELKSLKQIYNESLKIETIPRSLLFVQLENINYLLCGIGDGNLFTFKLLNNELKEKKMINLGTKPVLLTKFYSKGTLNVFASSDRPTVIYSNHQKLLFSNVNLKQVNYMCPFNDQDFSETLGFVIGDSLVLGNVDDIQKLHIKTISLNEQPRRISYFDKNILVATEKITNSEISGQIHLFDEQKFDKMDQFKLDTLELCASMIHIQFDKKLNYFVLGTGYIYQGEDIPKKGRILMFQIKNGKLKLMYEKEVQGAVHSMTEMNGKLITTINSKISIWKWIETNNSKYELIEECKIEDNTYLKNVKCIGDFIFTGDVVRSVSLYLYKQEGIIEKISKDYNSRFIDSIEILDDSSFIASEEEHHLICFKKNTDSSQEEERRKLLVQGSYHLGDRINKMECGSLIMKNLSKSEYSKIKSFVYGTIGGSIGIFTKIDEKHFDLFLDLQNSLSQVIKGIGGLSLLEFRKDLKYFIEGDLIESFLELPKEKQEQVKNKMKTKITIEEIILKIEDLSNSLH